MVRHIVNWIKTAFHLQGFGWQMLGIAIGIVGVVGLAAVAALWSWLRNRIWDFLSGTVQGVLRADVEVWHVLLVFLACSGGLIVMRWGGRSGRRPATNVDTEAYPREMDYLEVKWPAQAVESMSTRSIVEFRVGTPICPTHRSTLGLVVNAGDEGADEDVVVSVDRLPIDKLAARRMVFRCPNDNELFDLRGAGRAMSEAKAFVNDQAMGQHRTAMARRRSAQKS